MKHYQFSVYDEDNKSTTLVSFSTENDAWSGYNGPVWKFFEFLKGSGFVFNLEDMIGILKENDDFDPAVF